MSPVRSASVILCLLPLVTTSAGALTQNAPVPGRAPRAQEQWDRVLADTLIEHDVVVPGGERWLIGRNVRIAGNLRTDSGVIALRPGSTLRFIGADPDAYVGGGMGYEARFSRDIGLWIGRQGVLDVRGTPKTSWNRTGRDPSWEPDDEYYITPTARDDYTVRRWHPGQPIPRVDPRLPSAEVINVTRDIVIRGPGHIHIHSELPQRLEYVTLRELGISNAASEGPVEGRYALHLHHGGGGTTGTIVRGVAAVDSRGRGFVPHGSHGISFVDVVSVNSYGEAFWWDLGDRTDNVLVDRLAVAGVEMPRRVSGRTSRYAAVTLGGGVGNVIRNSVAAGARGSASAHGFEWPSRADNNGLAVWEFSEGNVAHNNRGSGIRLWFNNGAPHVIANAVTYRHGHAGIENGAYSNAHRYVNTFSFEDRIIQHATSRHSSVDGGPARFQGIRVVAHSGPALVTGLLRLPPTNRTEFVDCSLQAGPGAPKVRVTTAQVRNPFVALFRNCGLQPADVDVVLPFPAALAGTSIIIENGDGARWEITLDVPNQRRVVRRFDASVAARPSTN